MPERSEQINIKLTSGRKQRWKEAAENDGRSSLSSLIRRAVEDYINEDISTSEAPDAALSDELAGQMAEILERSKRVENDLGRINGRLNAIEKEVKSDYPEPVEGLNSEVYGLLPKEKDLPDNSEEWDQVMAFTHPIQLLTNGRVRTGKPEHITKWLNESIDPPNDADPKPVLDRPVSVPDVERAINQLRKDLHTIHEHDHGGYYRE